VRIDVYHHVSSDVDARLTSIEALITQLVVKEAANMAIGQDILDKVTAEDTKVDSVIALLNSLAAAGTIPPDVLAAILAKIQGSEDKLDAAIAANTPPSPPPVP